MSRLVGRITVHGDKPALSATVELHNATGDVVDQVQVDDDGRYTYHWAPGSWTIIVWDAPGHRGNATAQIEDGADTTLDLDLQEPEGGH